MTKEMAIKILRGGVLGTDELTHEAVFMAIKALKEQARADAVPVVRCKDCVHYNGLRCYKIKGLDDLRNLGDFCSWGERREDESN